MLIYRVLLTLLSPFIVLWQMFRLLIGNETLTDLKERIGCHTPENPPSGKVIWLHGASNGELTSARGLIEALLAHDQSLKIVVTSNTTTAREMVKSWDIRRLSARLAPLDFRLFLYRFRAGWTPGLAILLEGDLWPNRIVATAEAKIPVAMISARISKKSAAKWNYVPGLTRTMMDHVAMLSAQDAKSEQRFLNMGLSKDRLATSTTLKSSVDLVPPTNDALERFHPLFDRSDTFLAASTHEGEEEKVIAAFKLANAERPNLKMILAPRHPKRGTDVARLLDDSNLDYAQRSLGQTPTESVPVYLADTLGEMPLWYSLSGQCFVGGSLVSKGGHTPYEPAQFDCAILYGPDTSNFAEQYEQLEESNGAMSVADSEALARTLAALDEPTCERLTRNARVALALDEGKAAVQDLARKLRSLL